MQLVIENGLGKRAALQRLIQIGRKKPFIRLGLRFGNVHWQISLGIERADIMTQLVNHGKSIVISRTEITNRLLVFVQIGGKRAGVGIFRAC